MRSKNPREHRAVASKSYKQGSFDEEKKRLHALQTVLAYEPCNQRCDLQAKSQ